MSIEWVMPSNHLILCRPLLLLPSIFPSIRVFSSESTLRVRWPKYWSFSFSISPSNEHPGLVSLRMDWLDLLAVQGTLKSLLQHYSSKASILQCSAFFIVQLSYPYMTSGKTVALTRRTFVGKIMSLLFNMLFLHPRFLKYLFVFICLFSFAVLAVACVTQFPDQGLNPGPLRWEPGVLTTGPPVEAPRILGLNTVPFLKVPLFPNLTCLAMRYLHHPSL